MLNISNSTFTKRLTFKFFKLVSFSVCGITVISKKGELTFEIVRDTPFIDIEAFSIKNLFNLFSIILKLIIQVLSINFIFFIIASEST